MRLYKIGCPWPISRLELMEFAQGLDLIIVVEEKRSLIEVQVREELYGTANQPVCIGKKDERGNWLFPVKGALDPNDVAICIGERLLNYAKNDQLAAEVARLKEAQRILAETEDVAVRIPYFCSGCPHNTSTVVPAGSRAYAGIGCHYMAQWMDRSTSGYTQMGAEGTNWIGEAPFSTRSHVFQNLGDGTYNHSGSLAIRSAIQSGVNITYKILFNDAVAMTGGQHNDGDITVPQIANEMAAEGAKRVVIVTDEPGKYPSGTKWPAGVTTHHRDDLQEVQKELAQVPGCTVLIYDQTCAAEKRRRRKRGQYPDPDKRVVINELVCEGCGDCGVKSNCVSVQPLETEFGRKRTIDQSSCNKDFSCLKGFCPSFVTVEGAKLKRGRGVDLPADTATLASPALPAIDGTYDVIVTGVGGTGIVTIGAILGMAAHLEGKGVGIIDMAGLAQKGGAVASHLRFANRPEDIHAIRVAAHSAELVLGGDIVVAGNKKVLAAVKPGSTAMIINLAEMLPGEFTRNPEFSLPSERLKRTITSLAGPANTHFINASALATALLGQSIGANMFMLGYAYQLGTLPISAEALEKAIEMNGEAVAMNHAAFRWGRRAAVDLAGVEALARPATVDPARQLSGSFDEMVARRVEFLTAYQSAAYADRYRRRVAAARAAEAAQAPGKSGFAEAVARYLFKLMAYKDEYEVARLYAETSFMAQVKNEVAGDNLTLKFHLAPPLFAKKDPVTGVAKKMTFGPWMLPAFRVLAKLRFLRGTPFDIFGYSEERRTERKLIADYEALLEEIVGKLTPENHHIAVGLANIPEKIRGFGHVKARHLVAAKADEAALLEQFRSGQAPVLKAAE
jgi:indolepyruvate ferredoxin oxidoreductase